jgi:hypothetical protein
MQQLPPEIAWLSPWAGLAADVEPLPSVLDDQPYTQWLAAELQREVCDGHPLSGIDTKPIGFNQCDSNEFLFLTDHPTMPLALVHLTWQVETDPVWPWTRAFASLAEWTVWMQKCHESYIGAEESRRREWT